jgi:hypothetical protein
MSTENKEKRKGGFLKKAFYAFIILAIIGAIVGEDEGGSYSKSQQSNIAVPADQKSFSDIYQIHKDEYVSSPNELKKSLVRSKRADAFRSYFNGNFSVKNWIGRLEDVSTTGEGNAICAIELFGTSKLQVGTTNNEASDYLGDSTLIPQSSALFNTLAGLSSGSLVVFNATFMLDADTDEGGDFIEEQFAWSEGGKMKSPCFHVRLTDIRKYVEPEGKVESQPQPVVQ